jgi:hypothetical protein
MHSIAKLINEKYILLIMNDIVIGKFVSPQNWDVEILTLRVMELGASDLEVIRSWKWGLHKNNLCPYKKKQV